MQSKNRLFITILFLFILILLYGCKTTDNNTTDTSKKQSYSQAEYFNMAGNTAKEKKDGTRAIYYYTKAIETDPDYIEAYLNRGEMYYYVNEHEKALADFDRIIELSPQSDKAYYFKGLLFNDDGNYNKAIENLNTAISLNDKAYEYYEARSTAYEQINEYEKAFEDINTAIKLNQKSAKLYNLRGRLHEHFERTDDAINDFKIATKLDPNDIWTYDELILAYMKEDKIDKAFEIADKMIKLKPVRIDILYEIRATLFTLREQYKEAIEDCNASIKISPHNASIYNIRGTAYLEVEEYKKAIEDFDMAIKLALESQNEIKKYAAYCKQIAYDALAEMGEKK
ncbi:tetratricopeptide repeat protein [Treponema denticola]|nr:tetratricopeptide repeat protein [Treponema denticola]EPF37375.1 hypothetical protein HMPREF9732_01409 [Treponema denticola SP32]